MESTPQCVDKMQSNKALLETSTQQLPDELIFVDKGLDVHVQRMLEISRGYTLGKF